MQLIVCEWIVMEKKVGPFHQTIVDLKCNCVFIPKSDKIFLSQQV